MPVTILRIDDRLVHGQIMHAWLQDAGAKTILVADDAVATDATQQMCLKLVVPGSVALVMKSVKEAAADLMADRSEGNILAIVRNPKSALALLEEGFFIDTINLGNISNSPSKTPRKRLLKNIFVNEEDVDCLRAIAARGVEVAIRLIPTDPPMDALDLLNKNC